MQSVCHQAVLPKEEEMLQQAEELCRRIGGPAVAQPASLPPWTHGTCFQTENQQSLGPPAGAAMPGLQPGLTAQQPPYFESPRQLLTLWAFCTVQVQPCQVCSLDSLHSKLPAPAGELSSSGWVQCTVPAYRKKALQALGRQITAVHPTAHATRKLSL